MAEPHVHSREEQAAPTTGMSATTSERSAFPAPADHDNKLRFVFVVTGTVPNPPPPLSHPPICLPALQACRCVRNPAHTDTPTHNARGLRTQARRRYIRYAQMQFL